mgnify:CR=1 FL=1
MSATTPPPSRKATLRISQAAHLTLLASSRTRARSPGWLVTRLWDNTRAHERHELWTALPAPDHIDLTPVTLYLSPEVYADLHASSDHYDRSMGWLVSTLVLGLDHNQRARLWSTPLPSESPAPMEAAP